MSYSGDTYFLNTHTGESTWERPTEAAATVVADLPNGWVTAVSRSTGETYYVNEGEQGRMHLCVHAVCGANRVSRAEQ